MTRGVVLVAVVCSVSLWLGCENEPDPEGLCGNATVESPEECDDGNTLSGDGCSATCTNELPADGGVDGGGVDGGGADGGGADGGTGPTSLAGCSSVIPVMGVTVLATPGTTMSQSVLAHSDCASVIGGYETGAGGEREFNSWLVRGGAAVADFVSMGTRPVFDLHGDSYATTVTDSDVIAILRAMFAEVTPTEHPMAEALSVGIGSFSRLEFTPDGERVVVGGDNQSMPILAVSRSTDGMTIMLEEMFAAYSFDGSLITASNDSLLLGHPGSDGSHVSVSPMAGAEVTVSVSSDGTQATYATGRGISANSQYVLFETREALVADDTNGDNDIYFHNRDADANGTNDEPGAIETTRVSVATDGSEFLSAGFASMSDDARYIFFVASSATPIEGATAGVYARDTQTGATALVSVTTDSANISSGVFSLTHASPSGATVAFETEATNLVAGSDDGSRHVYVAENPLYAP